MLSIQGSCFQTTNKFVGQPVACGRKVRVQRLPVSLKVRAQSSSEGTDSEFVSGEWPVNWSLVSMEDCNAYYIDKKLKSELEPHYKLSDIMDTEIVTAQEGQSIATIEKSVKDIGCVPVTTGMGVLLGVIYEQDLKKTGAVAKDIMEKPIAGKRDYSVEEAACIMLKYKISSLPVVDEKAVLVGMVNSVEIFQAMEIETGIEAKAVEL